MTAREKERGEERKKNKMLAGIFFHLVPEVFYPVEMLPQAIPLSNNKGAELKLVLGAVKYLLHPRLGYTVRPSIRSFN